MVLLKPKTRKALAKQLRRLLIKHSTQVVVGLLAGLVTDYFAESLEADSGKKSKKKKHKSL